MVTTADEVDPEAAAQYVIGVLERSRGSWGAHHIDAETRRQKVEAVLLLAKGPLTLRKIAQLAGLDDATEARTLVRQLNELSDRWGRAMRIESIAGGDVVDR